jgi:hypothetical protein
MGGRNSVRHQFLTSAFSYTFSFSSGRTVGQYHTCAKPQTLVASSSKSHLKRNFKIFAVALSSILCLVSGLFGCKQKDKNFYTEGDYTLLNVDSFKGKIGTQFYVYKYDTARKLRVDYWDNGNVMAKGFTHNGKIDGWWTMYDYSGHQIALDSFHDGQKIISKIKPVVDTSLKIFNDGKLEPFKSIDSLLK